MAENVATTELVTCRRCARDFAAPPASMLMPSCPHCGASLRPLWHRIHSNRNAAVLAFFGLIALTAGILQPFMSLTKLGQEHVHSLLGGIRELYVRDHILLATILLVFSVVFPYAKLIVLLIAISRLARLSDRARHILHQIAQFTGRYSLLDLLVVAIIIVVVRFQGLAEAKAMPGTIMFAVAVFLSIAAGFCVNLEARAKT
jgi:paraquat-inducible protein A